MFPLFCANVTGQAYNCRYPNRVEVTDGESFARAVSRDYVCAAYKDSYRSNANFLSADCIAVDFDNDHSEDPASWISPEDVRRAFPDTAVGIHFSRNHLREKTEGSPGRSSMPSWHRSRLQMPGCTGS